VYVAYGFDFPDALGAASAAARAGGPVLLVTKTVVPTATRNELQRLDPSTIVVVGGTGVISDLVKDRLQTIVPGATVERHWGADRFSTAANVSAAAFPSATTVYLALGYDFPDALGAASAAGRDGGPVLLVARDLVPTATANELKRLDPASVVVVGGSGVISQAVIDRVEQLVPGATVTRRWGPDRFSTAASVSASAFPTAQTAYVAYGFDFPDALGSAAAAAAAGGPVLLVRSDSVPSATGNELTRLNLTRIVVVGGPGVISDSVVSDLVSYLP
jgi:putative cell wall-binding protein